MKVKPSNIEGAQDMVDDVKEPKNLGIKISSPGLALWTKVRDDVKVQITQMESSITVNKGILELAESRIAMETAKMKSKS